MKDEIKEILDSIQKHLKEKEENFKKGAVDSTVYYLYCDNARTLLNYITNLQEENVVLKSQLLQDNKSYYDMKDRIKKAIELLKEQMPVCIMPNNTLIHGTEKAKVLDNLLNILQGSDE